MFTNTKPAVSDVERCAVCSGSALHTLMELPGLPLTDLPWQEEPVTDLPDGIDQRMLICSSCGHGQLAHQVDPAFLYGGSNYTYRTDSSAMSARMVSFFLDFLQALEPERSFRCALEIGCNDLHLLKRLEGMAGDRVGVDPIWRGREHEREEDAIKVIGATLEEVNLGTELPERPDLVIARHTIEHMARPAEVVRQVVEAAAPDALFIFEQPRLESLVRRQRFDQVFHQHYQYFTLASLTRLFENAGAHYLTHRDNYHHWGAMLVAFRKSGTAAGERPEDGLNIAEIESRLDLFRRQMAATRDILRTLSAAPIYGYGAALMLPVLDYHLDHELCRLTGVLDDDESKDGLFYANLPLGIVHPKRLEGAEPETIFITATEHARPLLTKLMAQRPRHVIYPFHVI
jgi:SAM-dependent methyltransferase